MYVMDVLGEPSLGGCFGPVRDGCRARDDLSGEDERNTSFTLAMALLAILSMVLMLQNVNWWQYGGGCEKNKQ
jgi:hypothetical protein